MWRSALGHAQQPLSGPVSLHRIPDVDEPYPPLYTCCEAVLSTCAYSRTPSGWCPKGGRRWPPAVAAQSRRTRRKHAVRIFPHTFSCRREAFPVSFRLSAFMRCPAATVAKHIVGRSAQQQECRAEGFQLASTPNIYSLLWSATQQGTQPKTTCSRIHQPSMRPGDTRIGLWHGQSPVPCFKTAKTPPLQSLSKVSRFHQWCMLHNEWLACSHATQQKALLLMLKFVAIAHPALLSTGTHCFCYLTRQECCLSRSSSPSTQVPADTAASGAEAVRA